MISATNSGVSPAAEFELGPPPARVAHPVLAEVGRGDEPIERKLNQLSRKGADGRATVTSTACQRQQRTVESHLLATRLALRTCRRSRLGQAGLGRFVGDALDGSHLQKDLNTVHGPWMAL